MHNIQYGFAPKMYRAHIQKMVVVIWSISDKHSNDLCKHCTFHLITRFFALFLTHNIQVYHFNLQYLFPTQACSFSCLLCIRFEDTALDLLVDFLYWGRFQISRNISLNIAVSLLVMKLKCSVCALSYVQVSGLVITVQTREFFFGH